MEGKLPADIHADEIELGKVAENETIGRGEPNPLMNNKSAEDTKICTTKLNNINMVDTEKFKEKESENTHDWNYDKPYEWGIETLTGKTFVKNKLF